MGVKGGQLGPSGSAGTAQAGCAPLPSSTLVYLPAQLVSELHLLVDVKRRLLASEPAQTRLSAQAH